MVSWLKKEIVRIAFVFLISQTIFVPGISVNTAQNSEWIITEISRISTGGDAYTILVEGDYCYITCGYSGFKIFDISDFSNPVQVASIPQLSDGYAHQFILKDGIAYIGNGYGGIWIINCTNPENPSVITNFRHDYSWDIQIMDDILYAGNGHIQAQESITVTNISNLYNPIHIKTILTDDDIPELELIENKLYASGSTDGLYIYDITNKTDPKSLGNYTDSENPEIYLACMEIVGNIIYAGYYQYGLKVLDASNVANVTQIAEIQNSSGNYYSIKRFDDYLYISDISNGFKILDITTPTNPTEIVSYYYENCGSNDIFRNDNTLFVADRTNGLIIFNIGDMDSTTSENTIGFEILVVICLFSLFWLRRKKYRVS
jgi:hypothetical protein